MSQGNQSPFTLLGWLLLAVVVGVVVALLVWGLTLV